MPHPIHVSVVPAGPPEAEIVSLGAMLTFLRIPVPNGQSETSGDPGTDQLIKSLIVGARQLLEKHIWRSLVKKPYVQYMDAFPGRHFDSSGGSGARCVFNRGHHRERLAIKLWYPPLVSLDQIIYIGLDGEDHTLTSGRDFQVDFSSDPARIFPLQGQFWPEVMHGVDNAVRIPFTAGYEVQSGEEPEGENDIESVSEPEANTTALSGAAQINAYWIDRTIPEPIVIAVKQTVVHWYQNRDPVIAQAGAGGKFSNLPLHVEQIMEAYRCWDFALVQER